MSETRVRGDLQGLFGAVLGGLIASLTGSVVFSILQDPGLSTSNWVMIAVVAFGMLAAITYMVVGMAIPERLRWLGVALLWASGFTTIWTVLVSLSLEPRWVMPAVLAAAVGIGVTIGWRRFGTRAVAPAPEMEEA